MVAILCAVLAAAANAVASVLQRAANLREVQAHRTGLAALVDLLRQPLWLAGVGAIIVGFLLQATALATGEVSEVQPLMTLDLPFSLLIASLFFGRRLGARTWIDIVVMSAGIALFLFALAPADGSPDRPDGAAWACAAGGTAALIAVLTGLAYASAGPRRAALLGVASGTAFALTAVFMSDALADGLSWSIATRWQTYLVVVAGLTAMVLLQEALQAGSLVVVQPGVTLTDPVVAVVLGVFLFDEQVRTGAWLVAQIAGALAVAWGAIRLSTSDAARVAHEQVLVGGGPRDTD